MVTEEISSSRKYRQCTALHSTARQTAHNTVLIGQLPDIVTHTRQYTHT